MIYIVPKQKQNPHLRLQDSIVHMHKHTHSNTTPNEKLLHQSPASQSTASHNGFEVEETLRVLQNSHTRPDPIYLNLSLLFKGYKFLDLPLFLCRLSYSIA